MTVQCLDIKSVIFFVELNIQPGLSIKMQGFTCAMPGLLNINF